MKSGENETNEPATLNGLNRLYISRIKFKQFLIFSTILFATSCEKSFMLFSSFVDPKSILQTRAKPLQAVRVPLQFYPPACWRN